DGPDAVGSETGAPAAPARGGDERPREASIHRLHQNPGPAIRHAERPRRGGDRSGPADRLEQIRLAGPQGDLGPLGQPPARPGPPAARSVCHAPPARPMYMLRYNALAQATEQSTSQRGGSGMRARHAMVAILLVAALMLSAAAMGAPAPAPAEVVVYAAASLRDALQGLAPACEKDTATHLVFNFGASNDLAHQIEAGNKADVFFSADEAWM